MLATIGSRNLVRTADYAEFTAGASLAERETMPVMTQL